MFCVIDTETTGLNARKNAMISAAFVMKENLMSEDIVETREFFMNAKGYIIEDDALEVNGYTREEIASWPDAIEVNDKIRGFLHSYGKVTPVYHNEKFDRKFLLQAMTTSFYEAHFNHTTVDTKSIAYFLNLARKGFSDGTALSALRDKYGISIEGSHTALKDALDTAEIARRLLHEV